MAITRSGNDPLNYLNSLRKPEPANQSQYRGVNSNSTGGRRDAAFMPRVTGSTTMQPRTLGDFDSKVNPALDARARAQRNTTYPGMVGYQGPSQNDMQWAGRVNQMSNQALDSLVSPNIQNWRSGQSPVNVSRRFSSQPGSISVGPGAPWPMINSQDHSSTFRVDGGDGVMIPYPAPIDHHKDTQADWNSRYAEIKAGNALFDLMYPNNPGRQGSIMQNGPGMLGQVQALSQTPRQNSGFSMDGPQQVSASVPPIGPSTPPLRRSDVPAWSLNGGVSPETARASQDFNQAAQTPRVNTGKIISDRIAENMNNASIQGRQDANDIVDRNLNARMGFYSTPQARRGGFFQRGMGPMAGDTAIMARQNQPLSDGGPAAYAARSDQNRRRMEAEQAMGGLAPDGLTRYMPNQDLMEFANSDRVREDERRSTAMEQAGLGSGGTSYRQPMQAMTPSEIQFYRHKMNMASNPAYANRVMQGRADRQDMLDNRRAMIQARRLGALDAAGASQQMRNLMAGRGAIGPGQDGMAALMSLGAMQNPMGAMSQAPDMMRAQNEPMLRMLGYGNQMAVNDQQSRLMMNLMDKKAEMERNSQYRDAFMGIANDQSLTPSDKMRAMNVLNQGYGMASPQQGMAPGQFSPFDGIPKPNIDPSTMTPEQANLALQQHLDTYGKDLTPEQRSQYISEYGARLTPVQRERARRENSSIFNPYIDPAAAGTYGVLGPIAPYVGQAIVEPILSILGLDHPSRLERSEKNRYLQNNP